MSGFKGVSEIIKFDKRSKYNSVLFFFEIFLLTISIIEPLGTNK
jgi:hypothetical protein